LIKFREHVNIDKVLYSVPWAHIGTQVDARVTETLVEIYHAGQLIKTWPRAERGRRTDPADYPPEKIAFFMRTPTWCRSRADGLGEHVAELIAGLLADTALHHLRAAQGILGLADKYGPDRLDAACARSLAVGDPSYRTVDDAHLNLPTPSSKIKGSWQAAAPGGAQRSREGFVVWVRRRGGG
jgi:hypothetical protein